MKVIFLDNDGVICLSTEFGSRHKKLRLWLKETEGSYDIEINNRPVNVRFDNFNKKAIDILNEILEVTGAEIVVSSDWRGWATLEEIGDYYESQGLIKRPIGYTSSILNNDYNDFPFDPKFDSEQTRSLEILEWLELHPEVEKWVAIDDLDMSKRDDWGLERFVHTKRQSEGIKQSGIKDKVIRLLS